MATYSSFSSIGVSTPFLMKHRGLKIALRGYQYTQPTNRHVRHDGHREHYREPRRPRGLLSSIFGAFSFTSKQRNPKTVNTRPNHPLSRYPDLRTGVSRLALVPTRLSTSGLGTSGAAAPRNGATKRGSQARTARKAPPSRGVDVVLHQHPRHISHVPGLSDRKSKLGLDGSWLPTHSLRDDRGST